MVLAADVENKFLFVLGIWAADDIKNMSVHVGLLLLGSFAALAPVLFSGMELSFLFISVFPAMVLLFAKLGGAGIGGADIWAVLVSGIVSGAAFTLKAAAIGLMLFVLIIRKGKGAFLPYFLFGYLGAMLI